ncbi:hypothetical protein [Mycoplasma sp. VS30B]
MATNKDIEFLQQLNLDFESFKNSPFNMLKPFKIPKKLKTLMVEATEEEIYNTVLYSVYNACNSLINNVINIVKMKLENKADKFKECVGSERVELLSKAVFHEINYRFTTATTPELFNKLSVASNNIQVLGTPRDFYLAEQHLNPIARNFLEDGEWNLLGVELGKAYEKAIELDKKLEEFKEVLSKEITEAKNEANSIFKVLKTDYETRADDLYYKKWGKLTTLSESLVDKVTRAREEQEALLETNYKRLKNNADVNYDFYLNQIKERIKAFKSEIEELKKPLSELRDIDSLSNKVDTLEELCNELKNNKNTNQGDTSEYIDKLNQLETLVNDLQRKKLDGRVFESNMDYWQDICKRNWNTQNKEIDKKATKEELNTLAQQVEALKNSNATSTVDPSFLKDFNNVKQLAKSNADDLDRIKGRVYGKHSLENESSGIPFSKELGIYGPEAPYFLGMIEDGKLKIDLSDHLSSDWNKEEVFSYIEDGDKEYSMYLKVTFCQIPGYKPISVNKIDLFPISTSGRAHSNKIVGLGVVWATDKEAGLMPIAIKVEFNREQEFKDYIEISMISGLIGSIEQAFDKGTFGMISLELHSDKEIVIPEPPIGDLSGSDPF